MNSTKSRKPVLFSGVSLIAVCAIALSTPAFAQDTAAADPVAASPQDTVVVVTARRKALQTATERKKNADTVIDSVVADEAGKLPDTSLTEVLSRVSGVTMVRFGSLGSPDQFAWEGTDVQIRGLSGVTALLNGREVFGANGGNGLGWNEVTPEMMSAVDVYKASDARLIEGGTGGAIDLRTRMPFDYRKPEVDVSAAYSYGDLVKKGSPSASILLTNRWDTPVGEMGLLVDFAQSQFHSADSFMRSEPFYQQQIDGQTRYVPGGFDYGNDTFDRTRTGAYEAFQWKPNDQLTIWQTIFASNYKSENGGGGVFADISFGQGGFPVTYSDAKFDSNGLFVSGTLGHDGSTATTPTTWGPGSANNFTPSNNTTADFSQGFTWQSERLKLSGALQYVGAWHEDDDYGMGIGTGINLTTMKMDLTGKLPSHSITDAATLMTTAATAAPNSIVWNIRKNNAHMTAVNLDADYELGDGFFKDIKVGGRYADRAETDTFVGTWWSQINESWNADGQYTKTVAQSPTEDWAIYNFPNFFRGDIPVPGNYYFSSPQTVICASCFTHDITTYGQAEYPKGADTTIADLGALQTTKTRIETASIYGEIRFASDSSWFGGSPFSGNFGIRAVQYTVHSRGQFTVNQASPFFLSQADADASYAQVGGTVAAAQAYMAANGGNMPLTYSSPGIPPEPVSGGSKYARALPSFNVAFKPDSEWIVRVAVNQTISPPSFNDDKVGGSVNISTSTNTNNAGVTEGTTMPGIFAGYSGNLSKQLKPAISTNEDLSVEWYPSPSLTAHFDLFNKSIKDMIVYNQVSFPLTEPYYQYGSATQTQVPGVLQIVQNFNSTQKANIKGFEIGGRAFFDKLPSPFDGLGIEANYTLISSESPDTIAVGMDGVRLTDIEIPGLSKDAYNLNILYDKGPWDARLAYSWRGDYLATTTGNGTNSWYNLAGVPNDPVHCGRGDGVVCYSLPIYGSAYGQLDGSISYKVNDHMRISFQASNLTNGVPKTKMEVTKDVFAVRSWFMSDRRFELSLHVNY